jgi:capsular polysaccharide transport system permease protein
MRGRLTLSADPSDPAAPDLAAPDPAALPRLPGGRARRHATMRTIFALMLREMSTRYGRSPGGYLWAVIEPLGMLALMSVGFSLLLRSPALGESFILFYATGYLPFTFYTTLSSMVARAINFSKPLLAYPSVTWLDALLARFVLNTLTALTVSSLIFAGILLTTETRTVIELDPIIAAMSMAALLGLGIGTLNCFLVGVAPVWDMIWSIAMRPLFLASGVLFLYGDMPRPVREVLWYNPLLHVTGLMRTGFYPMYAPDYVSPVYVFGVAFATLVFGLLLLRRHHRAILNE